MTIFLTLLAALIGAYLCLGVLLGLMDLIYGHQSPLLALTWIFFWPFWAIYNHRAHAKEMARIRASLTPDQIKHIEEFESQFKDDDYFK